MPSIQTENSHLGHIELLKYKRHWIDMTVFFKFMGCVGFDVFLLYLIRTDFSTVPPI